MWRFLRIFVKDKAAKEAEERLERNLEELSKKTDELDSLQRKIRSMRDSITNEPELAGND